MFSTNPDGPLARRRFVRGPGILVAALAILASACAPGASVAPSASTAPSTGPATPAASASAEASPSASAAAVPGCGTDPVVLNAVFETGFDLPFKLSEEFTKQFPNVTWKISQDQFANLISTTPRLLAGDNPPDLIRLPTMVSLVKDNLLKNLDDYATAFGWDKWPAAQLAQNRVGTDGTRGAGSLYAAGLNYSLTGVFYNKELATQIGMTEAPKTVAEFEDFLAKAKAAKPSADHAVERRRQRRRTSLPAPTAHGRLRRDGADQRLDLPEVRRHDRHADQRHRRPASAAVDQGGLLPEGHERHRVHRCECPVRQGRRRVHVQWRLAERRV